MITGICDKFWNELFDDVKKNNIPTDTYKEFKEIVTDYLCEKLKEGYPVTEISIWIAVPISEFREYVEKTTIPSVKLDILWAAGLTPKWLYKEGYVLKQVIQHYGVNVFDTSLTDFIEKLNRIHLNCKEYYFMGFADRNLTGAIPQVYEYFFECNPGLFDEMFSKLLPTKLKEKE